MSTSQDRRSSMGSQRRKLRYKALLDEIVALDEETDEATISGRNLETLNKTAKVVEETKILLSDGGVQERVCNPGEGLLDSRVLLATSNMAIRCTEGVSGNVNSYNADELADHIRNNVEYWETYVIPKRIPTFTYLHGTFSPTPAERKIKQPRRAIERQRNTVLKEPENVDRLEKTEKGSEMVNRLQKSLQKCYKNNDNQPINYFNFVIDPFDFGRTVENIYNFSFLARDGFASIDVDEAEGLPFVKPVSKSQRENKKESQSDNNQFIVTIDMERWERAISAFNITEAMIK